MSEICQAPTVATLNVPVDKWTQPFWDATAAGELRLPACGDCGRFRWPPGPFCPTCQSQATVWRPAGTGVIYSFTVVREAPPSADEPASIRVPALIEFPAADGVRLLAAIADSPLASVAIGREVELQWMDAAEVRVPLFRVKLP